MSSMSSESWTATPIDDVAGAVKDLIRETKVKYFGRVRSSRLTPGEIARPCGYFATRLHDDDAGTLDGVPTAFRLVNQFKMAGRKR